jgi:hypothetical protein
MSDQSAASGAASYPYATYLNILFPQLSRIDVPSLVDSVQDQWYNQTLCKVNDSVVRLGVMQGEYHWHKHDNDDEFFFCLDRSRGPHSSARASTGLRGTQGCRAPDARPSQVRDSHGRKRRYHAHRRLIGCLSERRPGCRCAPAPAAQDTRGTGDPSSWSLE